MKISVSLRKPKDSIKLNKTNNRFDFKKKIKAKATY